MNNSDDLVRPIPTRRPYPIPEGVAVPLWVTRHGRHIGDVELALPSLDELAQVLASPDQTARIAKRARTHPGSRLQPSPPIRDKTHEGSSAPVLHENSPHKGEGGTFRPGVSMP